MTYLRAILIICVLLFVGCSHQQTLTASDHIKRGNALQERGDFDGALAEFNQAIAIDPNQPFYSFNRANARHSNNEYDLAITDYDKAIWIAPKTPEFYNNRGDARMSKGDVDG